ncbi:hypothetical protein FHR81_001948 [Actinoalloteichus hoggarensis]|uniref:DUF4132 domain-containing protein n=1 Tax=Actinoalloteichus hoggarensis TaxID=1470176 RepID=A0A221W5V6_9PSEU|nr:DUF4132 domain-containing protein [Actinoalloteichus hoggarensis]ASO20979.1 hypothetical protein AHOG_16765 [Actinoalloteichus hoggarensis]MBB5920910.1 hypothetical protein [Actinoalloteichus hoggarensis]
MSRASGRSGATTAIRGRDGTWPAALARLGRTRSASRFRGLVAHPMLWPLLRGLVWLATEPGGEPVAFRVAEDRTFADVEDDELTVSDLPTVTVAHPVRLRADLDRWAKIFGEYEIIQPFPQLGKPIPVLTAAERAATELVRFQDRSVPTTVLGRSLRGASGRWGRDGRATARTGSSSAGPP